MRNVQLDASTDNYEKWIGIIALLKNYVAFVELEGMGVIRKIGFLFTGQVFKESNFIDVGFGELIIFLDDLLDGLLEYLMRDAQKFAVFYCLDWRWSRCGINESQFSETFSGAKDFHVFFLIIELDANWSFSDDKEHRGSFALFKNVLVRFCLA